MLEQRTQDALQEIGNVGAAHAATALGQLLERTIMISVPRVRILTLSQLSLACDDPQAIMAGVHFHVVGDVTGRVLLMLPRLCALELVDTLFKNPPGTTKVLSELGNSTVCETGNIMVSAYLRAIAEFLSMLLLPSVPHLILDIAGAVMEYTAQGVELLLDHVVLVETDFNAEGSGIHGTLLLFLDAPSLEPMHASAGAFAR